MSAAGSKLTDVCPLLQVHRWPRDLTSVNGRAWLLGKSSAMGLPR